MQDSDIFRKNLAAVLKARDIKQVTLADSLGASKAFINRILKEKADPSLDFSGKIARALDLQLWQMLLPPITFSKKFLQEAAEVS